MSSACMRGERLTGTWKLVAITEAQQHQQPHSSEGASGKSLDWTAEMLVGWCDASTTSILSQLGPRMQRNALLSSVSARNRFQP